MNDETQRWMEAGNRLAGDPTARVMCPACQGAELTVTDVRATTALERLMSCPKCGARNFALLSGPRKRWPA